MSDFPFMEEPNIIDVPALGRWMAENHVSRATLASALGLKRSAIDNYFVRNRIPRQTQILINRYIQGRDPASSKEISSLITIPLSNRILNLAMKAAVKKGIPLEDFVAFSVEEIAKLTVPEDSSPLDELD